MRKTGVFVLVLLVLWVIPNCKKQENAPAQATREVGRPSAEAIVLEQGTVDSQAPQMKTAEEGRPRIAFDLKDFDFGKVESGERVEHVFTFRNTGDGTLLIQKVRSA